MSHWPELGPMPILRSITGKGSGMFVGGSDQSLGLKQMLESQLQSSLFNPGQSVSFICI